MVAPDPSLSFHAVKRMREDGVGWPAVRDAFLAPFVEGPAPGGARFACASELVGARRSWVTVVLDGDCDVVVTVYPGPPTDRCRRGAGPAR